MKGVRFTKAELAIVHDALDSLTHGYELEAKHPVHRIRAKLQAAVEPSAKGADVGPIQDAIVAAARGKVIVLEGGFPRASRQCADMGVTPETARLVGEWMARQGWLTGPMTLLDVLLKWHQWLPKARATAPPPSLEPGLGQQQDPGGRSGPSGKATQGGRSPSGFR